MNNGGDTFMDDHLRELGLSEHGQILFVDDEEKSRKAFQRAFAKDYGVQLAGSADEALEILRRNWAEIAVIVTDQRMPGMRGVDFLVESQKIKPECIRILTTAYADMDVALRAINEGHIYQFVHKPWDVNSLGVVLKRAVEYHELQRRYHQLLNQKLARIQSIIISDRAFLLALTAIGGRFRLRNTGLAIQDLLHHHSRALRTMRDTSRFQSTHQFWTHYYVEQKGMLIDGLRLAYQALMRAVEEPVLKGSPRHDAKSRVFSVEDLVKNLHGVSFQDDEEARLPMRYPSTYAETVRALQVLFDSLRRAMGIKHLNLRSWCVDSNPSLVIKIDRARFDGVTLKLINPDFADFIPEQAMDLLAAIFVVYDSGLVLDYSLLESGYLLLLAHSTPETRQDNDLSFLEQTLANDHFWSGILLSDQDEDSSL